MPHLIFEASSNIIASNDKIKQTMHDCQKLLVQQLPSQLDNCKSRLILHDLFVIGVERERSAFIHLTVKITKGCDPALLAELASQLQRLLATDFSKSAEQLSLKISVEIVELAASYCS